MATTDVPIWNGLPEDSQLAAKRSFKPADLPITPSQRTSLDALVNTLKRKGEFDALRKRVWADFSEGDPRNFFTTSLQELAESEIDREPALLSRDRGKAATLIEGAVDRSNVYKAVEVELDALLGKHIGATQAIARELRRAEIGEEAADHEEKLGSKSDVEYAQEVAVIRAAQEKARKQEEAKKWREEEIQRLREEERQKKLELEKLRRADEKRKEDEARIAKRKAEREERKKQEEQREAERRERHEKRKREEEEWERQQEKEWEERRKRKRSLSHDSLRPRRRDSAYDEYARDDVDKRRRQSRSVERRDSLRPPRAPPVDEKALEEAALELLLKEGRELAAQSEPATEARRSESLEPPPFRRGQPGRSKVKDEAPDSIPDVREHDSIDRRPDSHSKARSRSPPRYYSSRHTPDNHRNDISREEFKLQRVLEREREAEEYKKAVRGGRSRSPVRHRDTRDRLPEEIVKDKYRDRDDERSRDRRRGYERSRSRSPIRDRRYEKDRDERRRSDPHSVTLKKDSVEIDRYVPGGSRREGERDRIGERKRARDYDREPERDRDRHRERVRDERDLEKNQDLPRDRDRTGERERIRDRDRDRNRERDADRDRDRSSKHYARGDDERPRDRDRDRDRDPERKRHRDRGEDDADNMYRERHRDRDEDVDNKYRERLSREKDRGVVERDRDRESRSHRDHHDREYEREHERDYEHERERERDRHRDRDRERERERERERDRDRDRDADRYRERERRREERVE